MSANHSSQQGVPCIWLALGKASLTPRHGITFVPLREVGRPRPSTHRCNWMLAICLRCIKLTVRDSHPLDMLNLSPSWVAFTQFVGLQRKSGFLQASPVHKPSLKLCLRLTVPEITLHMVQHESMAAWPACGGHSPTEAQDQPAPRRRPRESRPVPPRP